jgi:CheY-like chemotaxis protein
MEETILVVNDSGLNADLAKEILEEAGYRVFVAYSGKQALDIYYQNNASIDLVFTNRSLPLPYDGYRLIESIRKITPNIKYIILCGACRGWEAGEVCYNGEHWKPILELPWTPDSLLTLVRNVLDGKVECGFPKESISKSSSQQKEPIRDFRDYRELDLESAFAEVMAEEFKKDFPDPQETEPISQVSNIERVDNEGDVLFSKNNLVAFESAIKEQDAARKDISNLLEARLKEEKTPKQDQQPDVTDRQDETNQEPEPPRDAKDLSETSDSARKRMEKIREDLRGRRGFHNSPQSTRSENIEGEATTRLAKIDDPPPKSEREQGTGLEPATETVKEFAEKPSKANTTLPPEEAKKDIYKPKSEDWYFDKQWLTATKDNHFEELQKYLRTNLNVTHLVKTQFVNGVTESRVIACHKHLVDLIGLEPERILNGTIWSVIVGAMNNLIKDQEILDLFVESQQERQNQLDRNPKENLPNIFLPIDTNATKVKYPLQKGKYVVTISQKILPFDNSIRVVSLSGLDLPVSNSDFEKNKEDLRQYLIQNVRNLRRKRGNKPLTKKENRENLINQNSQDLEDVCKPRNDDPTEAQYLFWMVQAGWHYDKKLLIEMGKQNPYALEHIQTYIKNHSNAVYILYETTVFEEGKRDTKTIIALVNQRVLDLFDISSAKDVLSKNLWTLESFGARFMPKQSWEWVIQQRATNNQIKPEDAYAVFDTRINPEKKSFRGYYFVKIHTEPLFSNDFCFIRAINYEINQWPCLSPLSLLSQDLLFVPDEYKSKVLWKNLDNAKHHTAQLSLDLYLGLFDLSRNIETVRKELYQKCLDTLVSHTLPALANNSLSTRYIPLSEVKTTISLGNFISSNFFIKENTVYGNCHVESFINLTSNRSINPVMAFYNARLDIAASLSQVVIDKFDHWYSSKFSFPSTSNILDGTQTDTNIFAFLLRELDLDLEIKQLQGQTTYIQAITNLLNDIYQCHKTIESAIYFTLFSFDPELFTPDTLSFGNDLDHIFQVAYSSALAAKPKIREVEKYQLKKGIKSNQQIKDELYDLTYVLAEIHLTLCSHLYDLYIRLTYLNFIDKVKTLFDYDRLMEKPVSFDVAPILPTDSETKSIATQKVMLHAKRAISRVLPKIFDLPEAEAESIALQIQQLIVERYKEEQQLRVKQEALKTGSEITSNDPNADDPLGSIRGIYFDDQVREKAVSLLKERGFGDQETLEKIRNGKFSVRTYMLDCRKSTCNNCKIEPSHKTKLLEFSEKGIRRGLVVARQLYTFFKKDISEHLKYNKAFIKKQIAV